MGTTVMNPGYPLDTLSAQGVYFNQENRILLLKGVQMTTAEKLAKKYSYADYLTWPNEERWELIDGAVYNMTPAPTFRHQMVTMNFAAILREQLKGKPCTPGIAPTDVVLSEHDVVQPDVFVICDKKKITEANIQGAPDIIIEVLSPATAIKDSRDKKALYEKHGVKEYILAHPIEQYAERFILREGKYGLPEVFGIQDTMELQSLDGLKIPLEEVFT